MSVKSWFEDSREILFPNYDSDDNFLFNFTINFVVIIMIFTASAHIKYLIEQEELRRAEEASVQETFVKIGNDTYTDANEAAEEADKIPIAVKIIEVKEEPEEKEKINNLVIFSDINYPDYSKLVLFGTLNYYKNTTPVNAVKNDSAAPQNFRVKSTADYVSKKNPNYFRQKPLLVLFFYKILGEKIGEDMVDIKRKLKKRF